MLNVCEEKLKEDSFMKHENYNKFKFQCSCVHKVLLGTRPALIFLFSRAIFTLQWQD